MCLAIFKPAGVEIDPSHLDNGAEQNPDGAGIAYADGDNIVIKKGFFDGADTVSKLMKELVSMPVLIHFRWSTGGNVDKSNCHPFQAGGWAMIHNGVIPAMPDDKQRSDTFLYVKSKMKRRMRGCKDWPLLPNSTAKMAGEIGHSKLVFLRGNGDAVIVNEKMGEWVDGCWYSNDGYKEQQKWSWYTGWSAKNRSFACWADRHPAETVPSAADVAPIGEVDTLDYTSTRTDGYSQADEFGELCAWCDKTLTVDALANHEYLCERCAIELEDEAQSYGYANPHDYVNKVW